MHLTAEGLFTLISGRNDNVRNEELDKKTWKELWDEFLDEARRYGDQDKIDIIGNVKWNFKSPEIENKDKLTGEDKKLIGEFIRKHHPRIAYEVSIAGFPTANNYIPFASDLEIDLREISGLLAKSHGIEIRSLFDYLNKKFQDTWVKPYNIDLIFLMVVIRISDYFQIDSTRTPDITVKLKTFNSPVSQFEHYKHLDVKYVQPYVKDPETIIFQCAPRDSKVFIKLQDLFSDIQIEMDKSWAVLGEIYGKDSKENQPTIRYRRVKSNIDNIEEYSKNIKYIPEKIKFNVSSELPKLLIGPLYGNDPTYGVRELLQNAVDSCREREFQESDSYKGKVIISFLKENDQLYFQIEDNGIGMSLSVIKNYFLEVGSSLRKSSLWKKEFADKDGKSKVQRSGKFGIGVLAAFLIGEKIILETRNSSSQDGFRFETNLSSEQIEISKITKENVGTNILIHITETTIDSLKKSKFKFDKWYTLVSPKVKYIDQTGLLKNLGYNKYNPGFNDNLPPYWNQLSSEIFNKVIWSYNPDFSDNQTIMLTCNGIAVPESKYYYSDNFKLPYISIFDFDGQLLLNLSRNKVDSELPFINELIEEIFKDVIAKLLLYPVDLQILNEEDPLIKINKFSHSAIGNVDILYTKEGFILRMNYFKLKNKDKILLKFSLKSESTFPKEFDFEDCFIDLNEKYDMSMTDFKWHLNLKDLHGGGKILLNKKMYNKLFDNNFNRFPISVRRSHNLILDEEDVKGISYNSNVETQHLKKLVDFSKTCNYVLETKVFNIISVELNQFENILTKQFEKFLKGRSVIPYDIKERKRIFPEAFEELRNYQLKYKQE